MSRTAAEWRLELTHNDLQLLARIEITQKRQDVLRKAWVEMPTARRSCLKALQRAGLIEVRSIQTQYWGGAYPDSMKREVRPL